MSNKLVLKNVEKIEFTNDEILTGNICKQLFCQCTNVQQDYSSIKNYHYTINYNMYNAKYEMLQYDVYPTIKASATDFPDERDMWRLFSEWTTTDSVNTDSTRYTISSNGVTILKAGYYRFTLNLYVYNPYRARIKLGLRFTKLPNGGTEAFVGPLGTSSNLSFNPRITDTDGPEANHDAAFAASAQLSTIINCSAEDQIRLRTIRMAMTDMTDMLSYTPPGMSELRCEFIGE
jgi:hypothetical protein